MIKNICILMIIILGFGCKKRIIIEENGISREKIVSIFVDEQIEELNKVESKSYNKVESKSYIMKDFRCHYTTSSVMSMTIGSSIQMIPVDQQHNGYQTVELINVYKEYRIRYRDLDKNIYYSPLKSSETPVVIRELSGCI